VTNEGREKAKLAGMGVQQVHPLSQWVRAACRVELDERTSTIEGHSEERRADIANGNKPRMCYCFWQEDFSTDLVTKDVAALMTASIWADPSYCYLLVP
jgi:hypothetical protein